MKTIITAILALVLTGCATSQKPYLWNANGHTTAQFDKDNRECIYDAKKVVRTKEYGSTTALLVGASADLHGIYRDCMDSRGYTLNGGES